MALNVRTNFFFLTDNSFRQTLKIQKKKKVVLENATEPLVAKKVSLAHFLECFVLDPDFTFLCYCSGQFFCGGQCTDDSCGM